MSLFAYELKKILRRPLTLVVLAGSLLFIVVLNVANMQGTSAIVWGPDYYATLPEGTKGREQYMAEEPFRLTGREAIALTRQRSEQFIGEWTDERVAQFASQYVAFLAREDIGEYLYSEEYLQYDPLWYALKYCLVDFEGNILPLAEAFPGEEGPLVYGYMEGMEFLAGIQQILVGILAGILLLVAIAPLFSDEVVRHTEPLLLSARHGRGRLVAAKLGAGIFFSMAGLLLLSGVHFVVNGLCFGFSGYNISCALGTVSAPAGMLYGQYFLYLLGLQLLGSIAFSCLLMLLSSVLSSPFPVLFCGALFFLACLMGAVYAPPPWGTVCQLLPPAAMVPAMVTSVPMVLASNGGLSAACLAAIALRYKRKR